MPQILVSWAACRCPDDSLAPVTGIGGQGSPGSCCAAAGLVRRHPAGEPVRLAKRTSNLFRPRDANQTPGLDVSGLGGVISVDPASRTADVQGMCTYENLVDATLPHGLIPLVVPQLRTITLGGAVTGLGIESTSFRNGLPHESVLEMDVLTGSGEIVTHPAGRAISSTPSPTPTAPSATPPGCGSSSSRCPARWGCGTSASPTSALLAKAIAEVVETGEWDGERVHGLDGVAFEPGEGYLTLARWIDEAGDHGKQPTSDYTGPGDLLPVAPAAQGRPAQHLRLPLALGHRLVLVLAGVRCPEPAGSAGSGRAGGGAGTSTTGWSRLDRRFGIARRLDKRAGRPEAERVVQDVELPSSGRGVPRWFDEEVGMRPVWLCPLRLRRPIARPGRRTRSSRGRDLRQRRVLGRRPSARGAATRRATAPSRRR